MEAYKDLNKYTDALKKDNYVDAGLVLANIDTKEPELMTISISGKQFTIQPHLIKSIPNSLLSTTEKTSKQFNKALQLYYFDRDPKLFTHILNAYREGEIHMPRNICPMRFRREMKFWGIPQSLLAACCWKQFYDVDTDLETLDVLLESKQTYQAIDKVDTISATAVKGSKKDMCSNTSTSARKNPSSVCYTIWLFLEEPTSSTAAKVWHFFYLFVVIVSAAVGIAWLYPEVRVDPYLKSLLDDWDPEIDENGTIIMPDIAQFNDKIINMILKDPHKVLFGLDCFCTVFFVLETLVHFLVCPTKSSYIKRFYNILRVYLCMSMVISFVFEVRKDLIYTIHRGYAYFFFKSMNSIRLLLLFRLTKMYTGLQIICLAVRRSLKELLLLVFGLGIAIVIFGGLIFCLEIETNMFPNTHTSMWWALITMTTIGYGDFYPTNGYGYAVGFLCAINGLIIMALPVAAIASNFADLYNRNTDFEKFNTAVSKEKEENLENSFQKPTTEENRTKY